MPIVVVLDEDYISPHLPIKPRLLLLLKLILMKVLKIKLTKELNFPWHWFTY
jgi:hypothetical protein